MATGPMGVGTLALENETTLRIKALLKVHPKGLTITEIASRLKMNRNSVSKYLEVLLISGHVETHSYGPARVFFLTHRIPISALISLSSNLMVTLDEKNAILYTNESFNKFFALTPEDVNGCHIMEVCRKGVGSDVLPDIVSDVLARQDVDHEVRLEKNGQTFFFKVKSLKMVFDDGSHGLTILMDDVSREKQDRLELEAKEARYRAIIEDQEEFIVRFQPGGDLVFVNKAYTDYLGKTLEGLREVRYLSGLTDEDRTALTQKIAILSPSNPVTTFECLVSPEPEKTCWNLWTIRALFDEMDRLAEFQAVGQDITEKKAAMEKIDRYIAQMEFFSRKLQEFIGLPSGANIYGAIGAGLYEILPDATFAISSYNPEDQALTIESIVPDEIRDLFIQVIGRDAVGIRVPVQPEQSERFLSSSIYSPPGNLYDLFSHKVPAEACAEIEKNLNPDFYSVGLIWQGMLLGNITFALRKGKDLKNRYLIETYIRAASIAIRRYMADAALLESENLYRSLIENVQDVFYRSDIDGDLIMASPSWARMLGYSSLDECLGENIAQKFYFEPEKRKAFLTAVNTHGFVFDYHVVLKKKDGAPLHVATNSHLFYDANGVVVGVEGVFRDITERRASEDKIRKYLGQMEFLSQRLVHFIDMDPSENIYQKIADDLQILSPGSLIIVNAFDPGSAILTIRGTAMPGEARDILTRILGTDIVGTGYAIDEGGRAAFRSGTLVRADQSLYEITFKTIPEPVCKKMESELGIREVYGAGFIRGDAILGNVAIFLLPGSKESDWQLVEMYVRQASIALQRYLAEQERHRTDEIFTNLATEAPTPLALHEPDGTCFFINKEFTRVFGYTLEDFTTAGEGLAAMFNGEGAYSKINGFWNSLYSEPVGKPARSFTIRCKDSSMKEVILRPIVLPDKRCCIIFVDITARKESEKNRQILSAIVLSTSDAIIGKDIDGTIRTWNPAAEGLYGYSADEIVGHNIMQLVPPDQQETMKDILARTRRGESVSNIETRRIRKDGSIINVSVTISPMTDEQGIVTGASTIARRIIRKAEQGVQDPLVVSAARITGPAPAPPLRGIPGMGEESSRKETLEMMSLANALKKAKPGIVFLDLAAHCTWMNDSFAALIGTESRESILGKSVAPLIASEQRKPVLDHLSTIRKHGGHAVFSLSLLTPSGRVPVEANVSVIADDQKIPQGYLAILSHMNRTDSHTPQNHGEGRPYSKSRDRIPDGN